MKNVRHLRQASKSFRNVTKDAYVDHHGCESFISDGNLFIYNAFQMNNHEWDLRITVTPKNRIVNGDDLQSHIQCNGSVVVDGDLNHSYPVDLFYSPHLPGAFTLVFHSPYFERRIPKQVQEGLATCVARCLYKHRRWLAVKSDRLARSLTSLRPKDRSGSPVRPSVYESAARGRPFRPA